jgi:hypothetical protein
MISSTVSSTVASPIQNVSKEELALDTATEKKSNASNAFDVAQVAFNTNNTNQNQDALTNAEKELKQAEEELIKAKEEYDQSIKAKEEYDQSIKASAPPLPVTSGPNTPANIASGTTTPANIASGSEDNIYIKLEGDNKYVILTKEEANKIMEDEQKKNVTPSSVVIMTRDSKDKCFTFNDGSKPEEKKGWFSWGSKKPAQVTTGGNLRTKKRRITKKRVQKRRPFKSRSKK